MSALGHLRRSCLERCVWYFPAADGACSIRHGWPRRVIGAKVLHHLEAARGLIYLARSSSFVARCCWWAGCVLSLALIRHHRSDGLNCDGPILLDELSLDPFLGARIRRGIACHTAIPREQSPLVDHWPTFRAYLGAKLKSFILRDASSAICIDISEMRRVLCTKPSRLSLNMSL